MQLLLLVRDLKGGLSHFILYTSVLFECFAMLMDFSFLLNRNKLGHLFISCSHSGKIRNIPWLVSNIHNLVFVPALLASWEMAKQLQFYFQHNCAIHLLLQKSVVLTPFRMFLTALCLWRNMEPEGWGAAHLSWDGCQGQVRSLSQP